MSALELNEYCIVLYCADNVHYMHTAQLINALTEAGILFRQNVS